MRAVVCLAGGIASGKTTIAQALTASCHRAHRCSFGDVVRRQARRQQAPLDRATLQAVGTALVAAGWPAFVDLLLEDTPELTDLLVVDGIRHVAAVTELARRFPDTPVKLIFLHADRATIVARLRGRGEPDTVLDHPIESSLHDVAAACDLQLDSSLPIDELITQIDQTLSRGQNQLDPAPPHGEWQNPRQCCQEHPIPRLKARGTDLAAQDRELMAKDQQFRVLGDVTADPQHHQIHRPPGQRVHQRPDHGHPVCPPTADHYSQTSSSGTESGY